jgi:hypothetical protein
MTEPVFENKNIAEVLSELKLRVAYNLEELKVSNPTS